MEIPFLVEPIEGGRFRARAGEPFGVSAEADSREEAVRCLEQLIRERLRNGTQVGTFADARVARPS